MRSSVIAASFALSILVLPLQSEAKGCLKGAAVGGVAGHVAGHHAILGATAGCVIEHHREKVADRKAAAGAQQVNTNPPPAAPVAPR